MKQPPREIEVRIEELVLHGYAPGKRWSVARALEAELQGLLAAQGVPAAWMANPEILHARPLQVGSPAANGIQLARAVYDGGPR